MTERCASCPGEVSWARGGTSTLCATCPLLAAPEATLTGFVRCVAELAERIERLRADVASTLPRSRERAVTVQRLQEATFWLRELERVELTKAPRPARSQPGRSERATA